MTRVRMVLVALVLAQPLAAQSAPSDGELHLRRLLSVPLGALPPMGMLMPASRNHNYWVGHLQAGIQQENVVGDLTTVAGGLDFQWRGGSTIGITGGYQFADCDETVPDCGSHPLFGARARVNVVTGGPTVAAIVGDNSATTTLGGELGFGYAPKAVGERNACAIDVGLPISVSLFQRVRLLGFFTPGVAWDVRCLREGTAGAAASAYFGAGFGIQQLGHPGFDVSIGIQRIVRRGAGIQLGVNFTYVRLP